MFAPTASKSLRFSGTPIEMYSNILVITCYETVHCTVSPKFINEFGATCLLCFAQFTPFVKGGLRGYLKLKIFAKDKEEIAKLYKYTASN